MENVEIDLLYIRVQQHRKRADGLRLAASCFQHMLGFSKLLLQLSGILSRYRQVLLHQDTKINKY